MEDIFPAVNLIRQFEGCRLSAYYDIVGRLTIGWGTTHDVTPEMQISQQEADQMLRLDCETLELKIKNLVKVEISNNALCALISFCYNLGLGSFLHSTLLTKLNADAPKEECAAEILKWDHAAGAVVPGLTRRRQAEAALFLS